MAGTMMNGGVYSLVPSQDPGTEAYVYGSAPQAYASAPGYTYDDPMAKAPIPETWNAEVAAGKAMTMLSKSARGTCNIEGGSVYGIALALPQFARTAGYSLKYTGLMIRAYFFLACNICLQGFLLYMISKEERIMSKYGGQMHLCDFGAEIVNCPDGPNCIGPGGTTYTSARLYNWEMWNTRVYVRDSLKALFPDRGDEIMDKVDPGEYGLESYHLRIVCCLLFVIGCWGDLQSTIQMFQLLRSVPSVGEPWMSYEVPKWDSKEHAKQVHGWTELNLVKFKVAGMPIGWKLFSFFCVWLPKLYIWLLTLDAGIVFLLETAVIDDMIINAVALAFILGIDELICSTLVSPVSLYMTRNLEPFEMFSLTDEEDDTERDAYEKHQRDKAWNLCSLELWTYIIPNRLIMITCTTAFFIVKYYIEHCDRGADGSWVSRPVYLPINEHLSFLSFVCGPFPELFSVETLKDAVWSMPSS